MMPNQHGKYLDCDQSIWRTTNLIWLLDVALRVHLFQLQGPFHLIYFALVTIDNVLTKDYPRLKSTLNQSLSSQNAVTYSLFLW